MNSTRGLTQGREARQDKTMRFLCGFAPWREIFFSSRREEFVESLGQPHAKAQGSAT